MHDDDSAFKDSGSYRLDYPGKGEGDFTERGREVAGAAIANLDIDGT